MTAWDKVTANSNLLQAETERSVLIKLPKSEFLFWHPKKLVRTSGKNGYRLSISFTDEFSFKIFRPGKGKYNKFDKIEEKEVNSSEFAAYFN